MKLQFTYKSVPISTLPPGAVCITELDFDDANAMGYRYVVREKDGDRVEVTRIDPRTATRDIVSVPAGMKVCQAIGENNVKK